MMQKPLSKDCLAKPVPVRVALLCTGVDGHRGGIETFFHECFHGLRGTEGIDLRLCRGPGVAGPDEHVLRCLPRNEWLARWLGVLVRRNGYVVEQLTAFPSFCRFVRDWKPDVIFYSDSNHGFQLFKWRKQIGVDFKLLFSNGGPCRPPFNRTDFVHQVAPVYLEAAMAAGEPVGKHFMVPYGINVPAEAPVPDPVGKRALRQQLGLPLEGSVVVSVGWISKQHKRMDYVIEEMAALGAKRPFLAMVGRMDESSPAIIRLARERLGEGGFTAVSVPYDRVEDYYRAADVFVLGSLFEGFGRVFLEALCCGLRCLVHDHPVMRYVLAEEGCYGDFNQAGSLSQLLSEVLSSADSEADRVRRWNMVKTRFSWPSLRRQYLEMFQQVAQRRGL